MDISTSDGDQSGKHDNFQLTSSTSESSNDSNKDHAIVPTLKAHSDHQPENEYFYDLPSWYRYVLVTAFTLMSVITGPAIMNWPPLYDMFHWANAYSYLCDPSDPSYEVRPHNEIYCDDKDRAIAGMMPPATAARFCFDLVGGALLDSLGAKVTTLVGIAIEICGWILIGSSSPTGFNGYKAGLILTAAGCDVVNMGIISIANLFPRWSSTIMSIIGAARSVAFANGLILREIWGQRDGMSLATVSFGFACVLGVCFVFSLFCVPFQTYPKVPPGQVLNTTEREGKIGYRERLNRKPRIDFKLFLSEAKTQIKGFLEYGLTMPYLLFCLVPVCAFVRNSYFGVSFKKHLPTATDFYTVINPFSMIPCPPLGVFADRVSTSFTIALIAICGATSMFLVMFGNVVALEYISTMINFVFISYVTSQFYVYVGYNYPQQQMGKLTGFALLIGGLSSLVATPMFNLSSRSNNFFPMDLLVVILGLLAASIAFYLHFKVERPVRREAKKAAEEEALTTTIAESEQELGRLA